MAKHDHQPELETLIEWQEDGGCEATDGCWVEPDGICEHGAKSWLFKYCDIEGCETEAMEEVEVSVNRYGDETRHLCYPCYEAYCIGVQHGEFRHGKANKQQTRTPI